MLYLPIFVAVIFLFTATRHAQRLERHACLRPTVTRIEE